MALTLYLAMTAAEMQACTHLPKNMAWMACHFSPYGTGLSNIPAHLPPGSMLILNDRIPPQGHDPNAVAAQLEEAVAALQVHRVLLDLQRPNNEENLKIVQAITRKLHCPVGVTSAYAAGLSCAVFLSLQLRKPLSEQLEQWIGRDIWLEAAADCEIITVTETGSIISPGAIPETVQTVHTDEPLCCRYCLDLEDTCARFTVWRDSAQLNRLLAEAEKLNLQCAVGLYQQLHENAAEDS